MSIGITSWIKKKHIQLKKPKDKLLIPLTKSLDTIGFNPVIMTTLSFIFGIWGAYYLNINYSYFVILISIGLLFDLLDGALARYTNKVTKYGAYLDMISDKLATLVLIIAIYFNYQASTIVLVTIILSALEFTINPRFGKLLIVRSLRFYIAPLLFLNFYMATVWLQLITVILAFVTVFVKKIILKKHYS